MLHQTTNMKSLFFILGAIVVFSGAQAQEKTPATTICNPVNLSYRFCLDTPSRREAADPSMILFKGEYYLFASKSGGYFHSTDLVKWDLIKSKILPLEDYAPTAVVVDDEIYFNASGNASHKIYKTKDPKTDSWELVTDKFPISTTDPMLFLDDDHRLYYYYGCSDKQPLHAVELDLHNNLQPIGKEVNTIYANKEKYGWERTGDYNDGAAAPWMEGSWMNKYNGKYYLQYACPGTQFKSYADGLYVADKPLGPFVLSKSNPFAYKPEGFANGAGHGSTFKDKYGNYWHIGTATISIKHMFERRLSLFPVFFDKDGEMVAYTGFGDYPMMVPSKKINNSAELFPGWMLLSYNKKVETSSSLSDHQPKAATDEDIRTWWSAATNNKGEFVAIDLGSVETANAIQINFAEQNTSILGRTENMAYQYKLEYSTDNKNWKTIVDKSQNNVDAPHDYIQLPKPLQLRYVRLTNIQVPSGNFAVSDLRVFGKANVKAAKEITSFNIERDKDKAIVKLTWNKDVNATGYNIRFGTDRNKLYENYIVYGKNEIIIRSLNADLPYYFSIDAFNEAGVVKGKILKEVK